MPTSSTTTFNLDLNNLVEEAFERCGAEVRSGYDMRTARRSLNLLTIEWANRGINLWTIEQGQIPIVTGQLSYPIPSDTIDLLDHVVRNGSGQNQIDINITRISESTYSTIPNKNAQGRPIQVWINRQSGMTNAVATTTLIGNGTSITQIDPTDTTIVVANASGLATSGYIKINSETIGYSNVSGNQLLNCSRGQNGTTAAIHFTGSSVYTQNLPNINVWPTGDGGGPYTFVYWRLRRVQDAGNGVTEQDIPFRFLPCMVAGLAFYLSQKLPDALPRMQFLKAEYEEQWLMASTEDRDKSANRYVPRSLYYSG
jgi:hypothetical protein